MTGMNISLFNEYNDYVDLSRVEVPEITDLVADSCTANPDRTVRAAFDKFIREMAKVEAKESNAFDPWKH